MRLGGLKRVIRESTYVKRRPLMSIILNEAEYEDQEGYVRYAQNTFRDWVNQTLDGYSLNGANAAKKDAILRKIDDTKDPTQLAKADFRVQIQADVNEILQSLDQMMTYSDGTPANSNFMEELNKLAKYEGFIKANTDDGGMFEDLLMIANHGYTYKNFRRVKENLNRLKGLMENVRNLIESNIIAPNKDKILSTVREISNEIDRKKSSFSADDVQHANTVVQVLNHVVDQVNSGSYKIDSTGFQLNSLIQWINRIPEPQAQPETSAGQTQPETPVAQVSNSEIDNTSKVSTQDLQRAENAIKEFDDMMTKYLDMNPEPKDREAIMKSRRLIDATLNDLKTGKKNISFFLAHVNGTIEHYKKQIADEEAKRARAQTQPPITPPPPSNPTPPPVNPSMHSSTPPPNPPVSNPTPSPSNPVPPPPPIPPVSNPTPPPLNPSPGIMDELRRKNQEYVDTYNSTPNVINMIERDPLKIYLNIMSSKTSIEDNFTGLKTQYSRVSDVIKGKYTSMAEAEREANFLRLFYFALLHGLDSEFIIKIEGSLSELESNETSVPLNDRIIKPQALRQVKDKYEDLKDSRSDRAEALRQHVDEMKKLSVVLSDMVKQQETEMRKRQGKTVKTQQGSIANPDYNNYEDYQKSKVKQGQEAEYNELKTKTGLSKVWAYAKYAVNKGRDFVAGLLGKLNTWMKKIQQRILEKGSSGFLTTIQKNLARVIDFLSRNLHNMITKYRDKIDSKVYYRNNGKLMVEESARPLRRYGFLESSNFEQIDSHIYGDEIIVYEQVDMIMEEMLYGD